MKTDAQLQHDVLAELEWEPSINSARIGVEVKDSIVTLSGHVDSYSEKWNAERAAQRVTGVKAITVEMEVDLPGFNQRDDRDIAQAVENVLTWRTHLPKDAIKVIVENGWITLSGEVMWDYERRSVLAAVRDIVGVKGVSNDIKIKNKSTTINKSNIEAAIKRAIKSDKPLVSVEVHGADVTLKGSVHSWLERKLARRAAWNAPGVHNVVDHIHVNN